MIWLLRSNVAVCIGRLVIVLGISLRAADRAIQRRLYTAVFEYRLLDTLVIFTINDLHLLHMPDRFQIGIRLSVAIWIIRLIHRSLPGRKICHSHRIFAAVILVRIKRIAHGHMIHGKKCLLFRKQR